MDSLSSEESPCWFSYGLQVCTPSKNSLFRNVPHFNLFGWLMCYQFVQLVVIFALQKLLRLMRSLLWIFDLSSCGIGFMLRTSSPVLILYIFFYQFSVSGFMLKPLTYLNLNFIKGDKYGSTCILLHTNIYLLAMWSFFPVYISTFFTKNQVSIWVVSSIGFWRLSWLFLCQYFANLLLLLSIATWNQV